MPMYETYDDEPADIFLPLPESRYSDFYALEMNDFIEDMPFFTTHLPKQGHTLELGCGTGRIGKRLASDNRKLTGIDLSRPMLEKALAHGNRNCRYLQMDMASLSFRWFFDAVIIPYNTLNLLTTPGGISACLAGCRSVLADQGVLLLQVFVPTRALLEMTGRRSFQFQILETPEGERVVKEMLRTYEEQSQTLRIEERYRVRPPGQGAGRQDFSHCLELCARQADWWHAILAETGFTIEQQYGNYDFSPFSPGQSSCLLIAARRN